MGLIKTLRAMTRDANVTSDKMLTGYSGYANGQKVQGGIEAAKVWRNNTSDPHDGIPLTVEEWDNRYWLYMQDAAVAANEGITGDKIVSGNTIFGVAGTATGQGTRVVSTENADGTQNLTITDPDPGTAFALQNKTVTPSASSQEVTADAGYDGLGIVTVNGDADLVAGNIKSGVEIFGATGSFTSDATAAAGDIRNGQSAYVNGVKLTGTLVSGLTQVYYHNNYNTSGSFTATNGYQYIAVTGWYYNTDTYAFQAYIFNGNVWTNLINCYSNSSYIPIVSGNSITVPSNYKRGQSFYVYKAG